MVARNIKVESLPDLLEVSLIFKAFISKIVTAWKSGDLESFFREKYPQTFNLTDSIHGQYLGTSGSRILRIVVYCILYNNAYE